MYLDSENSIPSITLEQKGENDSNMYGYIVALRYAYTSHDKFVKDSQLLSYGDSNIIKTMNIYFNFELNKVKPYDFLFGIGIDASGSIINSAKIGGSGFGAENSGNQLVDVSGSHNDVITKIINRARNFVNYNNLKKNNSQYNPIKGENEDNIFETFDVITRGDVTNNTEYISYFKIPDFKSITPEYDIVNSTLLNIHVKLGQILIIDETSNNGTGIEYLSTLLINCGIIIIIGSATRLDISSTVSAKIINNGIIICLDGGSITVAGSPMNSNNINKITNFTNVKEIYYKDVQEDFDDNGLPTFPLSVRNLKNRLHSVLVPASIRNMSAKLNLKYENSSADLYSVRNCLFISTNASKTKPPYWDKRKNKLDFESASPTISIDGRLAEPYYTFFIPDFLLLSWWGLNRTTVEDNLGTQQGLKIYRKDNNTGNLTSVPIITDKIVNYSMEDYW